MSADELRQAAEVLRGVAGAATKGPWVAEQCEDSLQVTAGTASTVWTEHDGFRIGHQPPSYVATDVILEHELEEWGENPDNATEAQRVADAEYVATMNPLVGLALADWLEQCAERLDRGHHTGSRHSHSIARLINGGAS
jgi:hypothetical protein